MIQFLRQKCCCDGPCPCAVSDDFASDSIADYDVTGTFAVAGGVLTATTAGTATQKLKLPTGTRAAGVKADVIDDSHALFGLVIGSGDNRIEWLWDVAGTQCTLLVYSEGVAIVDEDYAGDPTTSLEVQIVANDCSWDVAVYRDGTLLDTHTAVAVTFDADWTAFGVTSDSSGGTWDNLCLRACQSCNINPACETNNQPMAWVLTAADIAAGTGVYDNNDGFNADYSACASGACVALNGDWTLVRSDYVREVGTDLTDGCTIRPDASSCRWLSAIPGVSSPTRADGCEGGIDDRWFIVGVHCRGEGEKIITDLYDLECDANGVVIDPDQGTVDCSRLVAWWMEEEYRNSGTEVRLVVIGSYTLASLAPGGGRVITATYVSDWEAVPYDYSVGGAVTLDLDSTTTPADAEEAGCDWPATITMEPADTQRLHEIAGCSSLGRCVNLYSEHGLLSLDGSIGGDDFRVCLSGPAGLSNGPFTGIINGATQGMTGDCAAATIAVSLECKRVCEHRYAWVLSLDDGTNVAEIEYEPTAAPNVGDLVSGAVTLCGGSQAFAALLSDFAPSEEDDHPFICACGEPNVALLCASGEQWRIKAELLEDSPGSCPDWPGSCSIDEGFLSLTTGAILCGGTPISPTGFDDTKNYFRGPVPADDSFGSFTDYEIVIFCDGGTLKYFTLDASDCVVGGVGDVADWDCETFTGHIDWQTVSDDCCGSLGSGTIRLALG